MIRPGYQYPPAGQPVPAIVVAVTPGTAPVKAAELETKFGVPFSVIDATVEEQVAAAQQAADLVRHAWRIDGLGVREDCWAATSCWLSRRPRPAATGAESAQPAAGQGERWS